MTDGVLLAARFASYVLLLVATGMPSHALFDGRQRLSGRDRAVLASLAVGILAASVWWALANIAAMAGLAIGELDQPTVSAVLAATPLGALLAVRAAALLVFAGLLAFHPAPRLLAPAALASLATAAWAGHPGAGVGLAGIVLKAGDILHLAAAALWIGALMAFLTGIARERGATQVVESLSAFARTGTAVVIALSVTGILNAWLISDGQFPSGPWPALIGLKVALFLAMLGFAAQNRWRLVPQFAQGEPGSRGRLYRSLVLETACAIAIVAVVSVAGQLDPHGA
jgi:putative copper resistance protein D